jgi:hypothetical protein
MPITKMYFKGGVIFAKEVGRIDREDARLWMEKVQECAAASSTPVAAVIDALEVTFVTSEARQIFVRASKIPNLMAAAVAAQDSAIVHTASLIGIMSENQQTKVFPTVEDAWEYAIAKIKSVCANR